MYADVIVDISGEKLDRTFQYSIPAEMEGRLAPGMVVQAPFGRGDRKIDGYLVGFSQRPEIAPERIKPLLSIKAGEETTESRLIALAAWMRERYGSTRLQALKTVLPVKAPVKARTKRKILRKVSETQCREIINELKRKNQKGRLRLMEALLEREELDYAQGVKDLGLTSALLRYPLAQGWIAVTQEEVFRVPVKEAGELSPLPPLTPPQRQAVEAIRREWEEGGRPCLLHGVTGSGKTRVYMELIRQTLEEGRQVILLIPEISLTHQMVSRFLVHFGNRVSILNSRLSQGERYDQFRRAKAGEVQVMIGPRSALFTPFSHLGLMIIDEEHESTYKSESSPRYHARETAVRRAELEGAKVVLGSATPSLESYSRGLSGEYRLVELSGRFEERSLPRVQIVDLREEFKSGNRSILSRSLQNAMEERLQAKEQIMLFLNRRGYAGFVSCRSCGQAMKCPHCEVSLSQHNDGTLVCHYCGYQIPQPKECPRCGSPYLGGFKAGTQQIEEIVKMRFPKARVLRMDADTTRQKESYSRILSAFARREGDVLIGTQMIVKGHDFPWVTLVGVLAADLSLNGSDYAGAERTFQLLTQAVGRSGRGCRPGEAFIQTYQPEHYSILAAAAQDYKAFYRQEILYRELMGYPPASHLLSVLGSGKEKEHLELAMEYLEKYVRRIYPREDLRVIGPADQAVSKIKDVYRKVIYLKQKDYAILVYIKDKLEEYIEMNTGFQEIQIQFDFS